MVTAVLTAEPHADQLPPASPIPKFVPTLTDGTIVLDALRRADAAALAALDDEAGRRTFGVADPTSPMTVDVAARLIERWASDPDEQCFAVRRNDALIGVVSSRAEVGGWVAVLSVAIAGSARRAGLGRRALRLLA